MRNPWQELERDPLVTIDQAAKTLMVHGATIRRWIREGSLPAIQLNGKRSGWRIRSSAIKKLLEKNTHAENL